MLIKKKTNRQSHLPKKFDPSLFYPADNLLHALKLTSVYDSITGTCCMLRRRKMMTEKLTSVEEMSLVVNIIPEHWNGRALE